MIDQDICLTCLRIGWSKWLEECDDAKIPREVTLRAKSLMKSMYDYDPTVFCRSGAGIKAALIYLCAKQTGNDTTINQRDLTRIFGCSQTSLRTDLRIFEKCVEKMYRDKVAKFW